LPDTIAHTRVKPIVPSLRQNRGPPSTVSTLMPPGAQRPRARRKHGLTTPATATRCAQMARYGRAGHRTGGLMREDNSVGVVTGLVFVVLFLIMIGSIGSMTRIMQTASSAHDTAGAPPHGR
jgi:hypothetical protein